MHPQPPPGPYGQQLPSPYGQQPLDGPGQQPNGPYTPQGYPPQGFSQPPPQPPRKSWPRRHKVLTALLAIVGLIIIVSISASLGGGSGTNTGTTSSDSGGRAAQGTGASAAGVGSKVRDGKFEFVITGISHAKSVGDTADGLGDTAQGRYTILHIRVTNIGSESQTLDDGSQYVYDAAGRKFTANSSADIDLGGVNGQNSTWLEDINPGNTVHGRIAFDLPAGDKAVKAELHDSMFSGGVTVSLR